MKKKPEIKYGIEIVKPWSSEMYDHNDVVSEEMKMNILDASGTLLDQVSHNYNAFYIQVGISINIPELRRSPLAADHVQLKHVITDPKKGRLEEVRGQVLWKEQNPKMGQNQRRLIRNKVINKKKSHPY